MKNFEEYLKARKKSANTISAYIGAVKQYLDWYSGSFGEECSTLYRENVLEFISYLKNVRELNYKSINQKIAALSKYNDYLCTTSPKQETVVTKDDYLAVQTNYASPCTVIEKEVDEFRQRVLVGQGKRDYAIVTLICYTGVRISEAVNIKLTHICFESREITVVGKGDKQRIVYMNDKVVNALREYLKVRSSESEYMFVSRQSDKISRYQVNKIFNKYSDKITPHTLRHFFCTIALEKGEYSYHEVANLAGHSSIHTTMLYTNPTAQKMKDKANKL